MKLHQVLEWIRDTLKDAEHWLKKSEKASALYHNLKGKDPRVDNLDEETKAHLEQENDQVVEYWQQLIPNLKKVIEVQNRWKWFDIGQYSSIIEVMDRNDAYRTTPEEKLPFECTAISVHFSHPKIGEDRNFCLFCRQIDDEGSFEMVSFLELSENQLTRPITVRKAIFNGEMKWSIDDYKILYKIEEQNDLEKNFIRSLVGCVLVTLKILRCKNVYVHKEPFPEKLNKSRIKKGKIQGFTRHVLHVSGEQREINSTPGGGSHASPRLHFRRGHVRRLQSGEFTWVREHMVGKLHGFVDKDYEIKSP